MSYLQNLNPKAEVLRRSAALQMNITAARGLQDLLKTNFGPKGTQKMLVSGGNEIRITKDGAVLLHEMQIQLPTAALIARTATAQDDATGDGTTACILLIGELLGQAMPYLSEGLHPRNILEGFDIANKFAQEFIKKYSVSKEISYENIMQIVNSSINTKISKTLTKIMDPIVTKAILTIYRHDTFLYLNMVEIMAMRHQTAAECELIRGLVCDHGARHSKMPTSLGNSHVLIMNVNLEFEATELQAKMVYKDAETRGEMGEMEREFVARRVNKIIDLKNEVCKNGEGFVIFNMKGIDVDSLEKLAEHGILALRRIKRRNLERLTLACGGMAINTLDKLGPEVLGEANSVREINIGDDKFTVTEGVESSLSCTILVKGSSQHEILQIKDVIRDALRAAKNFIEDGAVVAGAGAFEIACHKALMEYKKTVSGKAKLGVEAFAKALLTIPKTLASNAGFDPQETFINILDREDDVFAGIDLETGESFNPIEAGIWDNVNVKQQLLNSATSIAGELLLVDEIIKSGREIRSE